VKAKIYTKTGDKGQTSLVGGTRVPKTHARLEAYGTLDELNSVIGLVRSALNGDDSWRAHVEGRLQGIQNALFNIGSRLACETESLRPQLPNIDAAATGALETDMDRWEKELPPLKNFILPGGSAGAAFAHLGRTVCRRAERNVLRIEGVEHEHLVYLNRLSDWLFLLARKFNAEAGSKDIEWTK
jgi:cob(I)alamin adenosyltransferase